jgi:hypothetical protein
VVISSGILLVLSLLAILAILAALYRWLADKGIFYPDFALPMLLLAGIVLFFGAIAVLVNVYRSVRLNDPGHALGLPEGSVRAIIALILIFLFFVAITFIYSSMLREGRDRNLQGLTPAQFAQLPTAELLSSTPIPATGTPTSYDVVLRATVSPAAQDVGKNLIVLLGTLVTAVAAFYFGSNSATSAVAVGKQISSGGETSRAAPQVVSIAPTRGGPTGGTPVVLSGSGFTDATAVNFGPQRSTKVHLRFGRADHRSKPGRIRERQHHGHHTRWRIPPKSSNPIHLLSRLTSASGRSSAR